MTEIEPLADAVTGAVVGRAVEPGAGGVRAGGVGEDGHTTETTCLNCGTALAGDYCHACGQHGHVHRSLRAFGHDLLHGVLHFEGKVWRTLPLLAWRPGDLTRCYIDGQRASFVSPIALFLFSVFLMFAVFTFTGGLNLSSPSPEAAVEVRQEIVAERTKAQRAIAGLEQDLREARARGTPTGEIEGNLRAAQAERRAQERAYRVAARLTDTAAKAGTAQTGTGQPQINIASETGWKPLDDAITKAERNPELLLYKLKTNAYKFSWMLIPLSVPFVWLLFPFSRRFRMYDHTVFVTYSLSFMTLLVVAASLLRTIGVPGVGLAFLIPPVHIYRQIRGTYGLSRSAALWRTAALVALTALTLTLFLLTLVGLGIFD